MRRLLSVMLGVGTVALVSIAVATGDDKQTRSRPEVKAVAFGADEAANTKRLAELLAEGWEYVGPLGPGMVAFRRVPAPVAEPVVSKDLAALQGVWVTDRQMFNGERYDPPLETTIVVTGNRYFRINGTEVLEDGVLQLSVVDGARRIDLKSLNGMWAGTTRLGHYRVDTETFKYHGPYYERDFGKRPKAFSEDTRGETFLRVLKREKSK
jgi:uncharacterized protein (TIGR03067 family)